MTLRRLPPPADVVEDALRRSRGDGCVVIVEESTEVEARFANNTTTTNGTRRSRRVAVASVRGGSAGVSVGVASRTGDPDLEGLVRASEAEAADAPVDERAQSLLSPEDDGAAASDPGFTSEARQTELAVLGGVLGGLGPAFAEAAGHGHVLSGFASHRLGTVYVGTSTGLRLRYEQPTGSFELVARSADGARSSWTATGTPWFDDIDLPAMHGRVAERLRWAERRIELPAGRYETILPPDATADLMVPLLDALSGRDAEDGRNAFAAPGGTTKLGQSVSDLPFELRSDPAEVGIECAPFFVTAASGSDVSVLDNGLALARTPWIEGGTLHRLRYDRAGALRSGQPVAPPVDNVVLELPGAEGDLADLVAGTERGLLVTCLWYIREVDPVTLLLTGLTRDGVYLVEHGEVVGAVNNFRFNESPVDMLGRVAEAGATVRTLPREWTDYFTRTAMPPLRVDGFNMSSVSQAS